MSLNFIISRRKPATDLVTEDSTNREIDQDNESPGSVFHPKPWSNEPKFEDTWSERSKHFSPIIMWTESPDKLLIYFIVFREFCLVTKMYSHQRVNYNR